MIGQIQHFVMMKRVDGAVIQCTIKPTHYEAFSKLGFVDHVDKLPKTRQKKVKANGDSNEG
jgi:hypothetical protein